MRKGSHSIKNHSITIHKEQTKKIIAMVPDGGNYKDLPIELQNTRKVHIAWTRMNSEKPCFTIDTGHNHHFHYKVYWYKNKSIEASRKCSSTIDGKSNCKRGY